MLDLSSPRWLELSSAGGRSTRLVPDLIAALRSQPSEGDWAEIWEQLGHQWTLHPVAYAALPHLVPLSVAQGRALSPDFLLSVGRLAAPLERIAPCPDDLRADYEAALRTCGAFAARAAASPAYEPRDYACVLGAAAALANRPGPGTQLFFTLCACEPEADFTCPKCRSVLLADLRTPPSIVAVDSHCRPISRVVAIRPRPSPSPAAPTDDFTWLASLCRSAGQTRVLEWLCNLYGSASCPVCDTSIGLMDERECEISP
jgi:hypothetical protein